MYERMNENNDINIMKDNRVSLHIDINNIESVVATRPVIPRPPSPDTCIICFDGGGELVDGSSLVITECGCKYVVHEECFYDWMRKKQGLPACIACNTQCFLKQELEMQDEAARQIIQRENSRLRTKRLCATIGYTIVAFTVLYIMIVLMTEYS